MLAQSNESELSSFDKRRMDGLRVWRDFAKYFDNMLLSHAKKNMIRFMCPISIKYKREKRARKGEEPADVVKTSRCFTATLFESHLHVINISPRFLFRMSDSRNVKSSGEIKWSWHCAHDENHRRGGEINFLATGGVLIRLKNKIIAVAHTRHRTLQTTWRIVKRHESSSRRATLSHPRAMFSRDFL